MVVVTVLGPLRALDDAGWPWPRPRPRPRRLFDLERPICGLRTWTLGWLKANRGMASFHRGYSAQGYTLPYFATPHLPPYFTITTCNWLCNHTALASMLQVVWSFDATTSSSPSVARNSFARQPFRAAPIVPRTTHSLPPCALSLKCH